MIDQPSNSSENQEALNKDLASLTHYVGHFLLPSRLTGGYDIDALEESIKAARNLQENMDIPEAVKSPLAQLLSQLEAMREKTFSMVSLDQVQAIHDSISRSILAP